MAKNEELVVSGIISIHQNPLIIIINSESTSVTLFKRQILLPELYFKNNSAVSTQIVHVYEAEVEHFIPEHGAEV